MKVNSSDVDGRAVTFRIRSDQERKLRLLAVAAGATTVSHVLREMIDATPEPTAEEILHAVGKNEEPA